MALRARNRPSTDFSLASISDIVFLLLIFFMLTSSFVVQPGVKIELPQSSSEKPSTGQITVTISKEKAFFWNADPIEKELIPDRVKEEFEKMKRRDPKKKFALTLRTDKEVTMEESTYVISAVAEVGGSVVIATRKN